MKPVPDAEGRVGKAGWRGWKQYRGKGPAGGLPAYAKPAFTLLELLVVISIISVLAALMTPAISLAKQKANATQCMNNLKQIGLAVMMYGDDYRVYPMGADGINMVHWNYSISANLSKMKLSTWDFPNLRSPALYCPSSSIKPTGTNIFCTYSVHERIFGNTWGAAWSGFPRAYPFDERPSQVIMGGDSAQNPASAGEARETFTWWGGLNTTDYSAATANDPVVDYGNNTDTDPNLSKPRFRHAGTANFLFMDGHVQAMAPSDLRLGQVQISTGPLQ
jgi:prepilin-type N-terminal cleavage/methylation domain-containing protein/prepilin-type processing-associated H-X9-DG protein